MSTRNRERRAANRERRAAAEEHAHVRARRQRWGFAIFGLLVAVVVAVVVVAKPFDDDDDSVEASTPEPAGDCVEVVDPIPEGTPDVPVEVGPPPTELLTEDLVEGTGEVVPEGATVTVNYVGVACSTGKIFDESYTKGEPVTFSLTGVIPGWAQGIPGMKVGGQRLLGIPPDLAYGEAGSPPDIAPNETLWFVVEVESFEPAAAPTDTTVPVDPTATTVPAATTDTTAATPTT